MPESTPVPNQGGVIDPLIASPAPAACPACGHLRERQEPIWSVVTPRGRNPWTRCGRCQTYFLDDPYDLTDEVAHTETLPWGQLEAGRDLNVFKHRMFASALRLLERHQPVPARVLDVGCSFGGFAIEAERAGYDVCGMDLNPAAVEYVQSLGMEAECCASPGELVGIPDGTVDIVTCFDCNSLWADQPAELAAIWEKLRPGGHLLLRVVDKSWMFTLARPLVPIAPSLARRVMREAVNDNRFSMPVHLLSRQLEEHGFEVVAVSIWSAMHSEASRWPVKVSFVIGAALWPLLRRNYAPGAMLLARRRPSS